MDERELVTRAEMLPERFAGRLPDDQLEWLQSLAEGGEYEELLDALTAGLRKRRVAVTTDELGELQELVTGFELPDHMLARLRVAA
jgi:Arc/MetJ-type ribon-helix-helix transcriptional regulator